MLIVQQLHVGAIAWPVVSGLRDDVQPDAVKEFFNNIPGLCSNTDEGRRDLRRHESHWEDIKSYFSSVRRTRDTAITLSAIETVQETLKAL